MSKVILKNVNINDIISTNEDFLTIKELLNIIKYDLDKLYIDRFWFNIKDDKWIYLDNELILWLEYKEINKGKEAIIKLLKKYNIENEEYKLLSNHEFDINNFCSHQSEEQNKNEEKRGAHNKQYITVSPDCFKELCMHIGTNKSKEIKKYYIELEKVFKFYLEYQNEYRRLELETKDKELENKQKELEETKDKVMDMERDFQHKELEFDEFIYIATNESYHKQNVYKIGKSSKLNKREKCFNTFFINGQKVYYIYIFQCHNSRVLEQLLFTCLSNYKYNKVNELFNIELSKLYKMIFNIGCKYNSIINFSNKELFDSNIDKILLNEIPSSQIYPINYKNSKLDEYNEFLLKQYVNNKNISNIILKDFKDFDFEDHILINNKALSFDPKTKYYYFTYYNKMIYVCTNCGSFKKDKRSFEQHIRKRNKCMTIQLNLNSMEDIENGLEKQNIKLYSCEKCPETVFKTYDHYKRHLSENCKN